jgi:transposase
MYSVANALTREPALLVTENLGEGPQESMRWKNKGLRHRVRQLPFRGIVRVVGDKATERGSSFAMVSAYRNSRTCPLHGEELSFTKGQSWVSVQGAMSSIEA